MRYIFSFRVDSGIARLWAVCLLVGVLAAPASCADADAAVQKRAEALVCLLGSENFDEREQAAQALINIGQPALELLRQALTSQDPEVVKRAKACIPEIERDVKVLALATRLASKSSKERNEAAFGLYDIGSGAQRALPALIAALDEPEPKIRRTVVLALARLGPAADSALPKLTGMLRDRGQGDDVRWVIARVLGKRESLAPDVVPILLHILRTESVELQSGAVIALGDLGRQDKRVIPALVEALAHESDRVNTQAAASLLKLSTEPDLSIPALLVFMKKHIGDAEYEQARYYIASELFRFGSYAKKTVPALIELVSDNNELPEARAGAAASLAQLGSEAKSSLPALKAVLGNLPNANITESRLRSEIEKALEAIEKAM